MIGWVNVVRKYSHSFYDNFTVKCSLTAYSPGYRSERRRLGCVQAGYGLEVDGVDHSHHFRVRIRHCVFLHA